ncbi:MAG: hypothetical protein HY760_08145, partial [Nitrospirae bacterium]|nr:hypothetical protein [Nitrospirota bacterium]
MIPSVDLFSLPEEAARQRLLKIMKRVTFRYSEQEEFRLASGRKSRYYFDCKPTFSHAEARALIGRLIWDRLGTVAVDVVGGMAVGAIPIANAVSDAAFRKGMALRFVEGGKSGVTLHAPKGLAVVGDVLYVTDIDAVRGFDKETGNVLHTIDLKKKGALFLNDLTVDDQGVLYVSDTTVFVDPQAPPTLFKIDT